MRTVNCRAVSTLIVMVAIGCVGVSEAPFVHTIDPTLPEHTQDCLRRGAVRDYFEDIQRRTMKKWTLPPPEAKKILRKAVAFGFWAGAFLAVTGLAVNASKYQAIPGYVTRSIVIGVLSVVIYGTLGYLFWAGKVFKD